MQKCNSECPKSEKEQEAPDKECITFAVDESTTRMIRFVELKVPNQHEAMEESSQHNQIKKEKRPSLCQWSKRMYSADEAIDMELVMRVNTSQLLNFSEIFPFLECRFLARSLE